MNLSDKIMGKNMREPIKSVVLVDDLRAAIKELKEEIKDYTLFISNNQEEEFVRRVDKIFGKELTQSEPETKRFLPCGKTFETDLIHKDGSKDILVCRCGTDDGLCEECNTQQGERARKGNLDNTSNEVISSASQSTSNKRDMGNPAGICICGHDVDCHSYGEAHLDGADDWCDECDCEQYSQTHDNAKGYDTTMKIGAELIRKEALDSLNIENRSEDEIL